MPFADIYRNRKVLVTGHTGFKGAWLCEWLLELGADVSGFALEKPPTSPSLFEELNLASRLRHTVGDIRDPEAVRKTVADLQPEFIFHLAAQPLVRLSYEEPLETFAANVMGTAHVLEAVRKSKLSATIVSITTDKCYENRHWIHSYREEDAMGGYDPYSASKGAAELLIDAYRRSYFSGPGSEVRLASARAGNVIGGGDWAVDRIMPDCIRALHQGRTILVRNRHSTRPWQHVLEPLSGYLELGARIASDTTLCSAFNFGPKLDSNRTVKHLVEETLAHWPGKWEDQSDPHAVHEASLLNLATDKAYHLLGWEPVWDFARTVAQTVNWYRSALEAPGAAPELTRNQISEYVMEARNRQISWSQ